MHNVIHAEYTLVMPNSAQQGGVWGCNRGYGSLNKKKNDPLGVIYGVLGGFMGFYGFLGFSV